MPKLPPNSEEVLYNSATVAKPIVEKSSADLPITKEGMWTRKRAIREGRCITAPKGGVPAKPAKKAKKKATKKKVAKKDK